ncbi:hypothetical protein EJ110_NYTH36329 [Nymphaea thermarum]|nr:hypothetical protein EJ110_NYTH36329 [Nymphaea thermarum]
MQKKVLLVGIDESHASFYSLEWAIDHLLAPDPPNSIFKLVLVHVKLPALSILRVSGPGIGGDILPTVEADLKKTAAVVTDKAKELCKRKSVKPLPFCIQARGQALGHPFLGSLLSISFGSFVINFHVDIVEGDARSALCQAVEKYHADILVVGSHGHGAFRR